jgi:hypothetical protein
MHLERGSGILHPSDCRCCQESVCDVPMYIYIYIYIYIYMHCKEELRTCMHVKTDIDKFWPHMHVYEDRHRLVLTAHACIWRQTSTNFEAYAQMRTCTFMCHEHTCHASKNKTYTYARILQNTYICICFWINTYPCVCILKIVRTCVYACMLKQYAAMYCILKIWTHVCICMPK